MSIEGLTDGTTLVELSGRELDALAHAAQYLDGFALVVCALGQAMELEDLRATAAVLRGIRSRVRFERRAA
jgi:hypothetical protein